MYKFLYRYVSKVRITLDSKLRSSVGLLDYFLMPNVAIPSMETNQSILEVKFNHFLPEFIQDIIQLGNIQHTAASKYAACRIYQ
jgi:hypothetical protein